MLSESHEIDLLRSTIVLSSADAQWANAVSLPVAAPVKIVLLTVPLTDEDELQAHKLLQGGCKAALSDYIILSTDQPYANMWQAVHAVHKPQVVILAGIHPSSIGINALFGFNYANNFSDTLIIPTASMEQLRTNPALKKALWENALQPLFSPVNQNVAV